MEGIVWCVEVCYGVLTVHYDVKEMTKIYDSRRINNNIQKRGEGGGCILLYADAAHDSGLLDY